MNVEHDSSLSVDELLCHCNPDTVVTVAEFQRVVAASPNEDFYDLCSRVSVGQKCTACLLDAEQIYCAGTGGSVGARPKDLQDAAPVASARVGLKARFYRFLDSVLPAMTIPRHELAPVIGGKGLTTELVISNVVPKGFPPAATIDVTTEVRDTSGRKRKTWRNSIAPGTTTVLPLSSVIAPAAADAVTYGSAWITVVPRSGGHFGFTRPHFVVRSAAATSAVHTQGRSVQDTCFTAAQSDGTRNLVSHINLSSRPNQISISLRPRGRPDVERTFERTIPGKGCDMFTIPVIQEQGAAIHDLYTVHVKASLPVRRNVLIADAGFKRLSWDHM